MLSALAPFTLIQGPGGRSGFQVDLGVGGTKAGGWVVAQSSPPRMECGGRSPGLPAPSSVTVSVPVRRVVLSGDFTATVKSSGRGLPPTAPQRHQGQGTEGR